MISTYEKNMTMNPHVVINEFIYTEKHLFGMVFLMNNIQKNHSQFVELNLISFALQFILSAAFE